MQGFKEGYSFFEENAGAKVASEIAAKYIDNIEIEIERLVADLNSFQGFSTNTCALKGDIAEFWHSDTYNINAIVADSKNRTNVDRSHTFASADITSNFGEYFGLKYYKNGAESAKQQSKSVFERFIEYKSQGGKDTLEQFLKKRGFDNIEAVLNEPIYKGQVRIIPKDQLTDAVNWLERKIEEESQKRPEQVQRYKETLGLLQDRLTDKEGVGSVPLSKEDSEMLARLAKSGEVDKSTLKDLRVSKEDLITFEYAMQESFKAGMNAAIISMVLRVAPEIFKVISYLLSQGEIDEGQFRKIGFAAVQGSAEGFLTGAVSAAITNACKTKVFGEVLVDISPSIISSAVVVSLHTMKNAFSVVNGTMKTKDMVNELLEEMFISTCSLIGGCIGEGLLIQIPILGYLIGSFMGSVIGSFAYKGGVSAVLALCVNSGFTMFGLVDQNYRIPEEVMKQIGIEVFEYEKFEYEKFTREKFEYEKFEYERFEMETLDIICLRRGVIGVRQIGYI